ncbi:MAG TPA: hypothetical protein VK013_12985 [Myxococcaceae bacterium]|nr:hypothetical protein [Myxococcaceae bacterium]
MSDSSPRFILCCDWSKEASGRAVYVADVAARTVRHVGLEPSRRPDGGAWTFEATLAHARILRREGPVLLTFDAPLGVPASYLEAARQQGPWHDVRDFVEWLPRACETPGFFENGDGGEAWALTRPFIHLAKGTGSLQAFRERAGALGVELERDIERRTRAKSVFLAAGLPGSVGSAAKDLWKGLAGALRAPSEGARDFGIWPFEGTLGAILSDRGIAIGEIYPRAAYGLALSRRRVEKRACMAINKTRLEDRTAALAWLLSDSWLPDGCLSTEALRYAMADEQGDAFDAAMSCIALMRCFIEGTPLSDPSLEDPVAEGGILGTGSVNLDLPEKAFSGRHRSMFRDTPAPPASLVIPRTTPVPVRTEVQQAQGLACPIPGCPHRFRRGRLGWDGHVGSPRRHPGWLPDVRDPEERKRAFRVAFPSFFET